MFYNEIAPFLDRSSFIRDFDIKIVSTDDSFCFSGLQRSVKSLLITRAVNISGKSILLVCADEKLAEEYTDDLELLLGIDRVRFFPDFEVQNTEIRDSGKKG